jgi:hypothetical protein
MYELAKTQTQELQSDLADMKELKELFGRQVQELLERIEAFKKK